MIYSSLFNIHSGVNLLLGFPISLLSWELEQCDGWIDLYPLSLCILQPLSIFLICLFLWRRRRERSEAARRAITPNLSVVTIRALRILSQNARSTGARRPNIRIQKTAVLPAHKSTSKFNRFSLSLHLSNRTISNKEKRGKFLSPRGTFDLGVALHGFLPNSPPKKRRPRAR